MGNACCVSATPERSSGRGTATANSGRADGKTPPGLKPNAAIKPLKIGDATHYLDTPTMPSDQNASHNSVVSHADAVVDGSWEAAASQAERNLGEP